MAWVGPHANHLHLAPDRQPCQHLITQFLQAGCSSWCSTNIFKALKATEWWSVGLLTTASSLKDVNITQHTVAIYPQSLAGCKPKPTVNCKNSSRVCVSLCTTVIHNTAQNSYDNISSYPPDNHHCSDVVYGREGLNTSVIKKLLSTNEGTLFPVRRLSIFRHTLLLFRFCRYANVCLLTCRKWYRTPGSTDCV